MFLFIVHHAFCAAPKFSQLYKISAILDKAGLSSAPVFKVTDKFSPSPGASSVLEMYIISVAVETDHIVGVLVEKGQYTAAREYAFIAGLPVSEVTLKEVVFLWNCLLLLPFFTSPGGKQVLQIPQYQLLAVPTSSHQLLVKEQSRTNGR